MENLKERVEDIAENYFVDPSEEKVGNKVVPHWNVLMSAFTYIERRNLLMVGRPGTGKTTLACIVSSVFSGLPLGLFDFLKIQGHPDQTKDTMLARIDLGRLAEEGVVFQPGLYLPVTILDEINRNSPGKQAIIIEFVRTGAVEHLGKYFSREKQTFLATKNQNGPGTYPLPGATLDRFDISLEFTPGPSYVQRAVMEASERQCELTDAKRTKEIITTLLDKNKNNEEKLSFIQKQMTSLDIEIPSLELTPDATTFLSCIWEEFNTTWLYGDNRGEDPADTSDHNKSFASSHIEEGISPRAYNSITRYANMLANYLGDSEVDLDHIQTIAPYCLAHRIHATDDYKAHHAVERRLCGEREEQDLVRRIILDVKTNYDKVHTRLKLADAAVAKSNLNEAQQNELSTFLNGPEPDHPLLRQYHKHLKS